MDLNLDELRRLAEAVDFIDRDDHWYNATDLQIDGFDVNDASYIVAMHPRTTLALLDTIAELRHELKQQIDADNALVQRLRQEKEAVEQKATRLQRLIDRMEVQL